MGQTEVYAEMKETPYIWLSMKEINEILPKKIRNLSKVMLKLVNYYDEIETKPYIGKQLKYRFNPDILRFKEEMTA